MPLLEHSQRLLSREFRVHGCSMEPTFPADSWVRIVPFLWGTLRRQEVIALRAPQVSGRIDLKRIIGIPGDRVSWLGDDVWVNLETPGNDFQTLNLNENEYFVAGDNHISSYDSRTYGPIPAAAILGRILE